jgi:hypothetical protein
MNQTEDDYIQPNDANTLSSIGTYGSRVFDPLDGSYVIVNVCDDCLEAALADGRAAIHQPRPPQRTQHHE